MRSIEDTTRNNPCDRHHLDILERLNIIVGMIKDSNSEWENVKRISPETIIP
jgi:hypothetical protein